MHFAILHLAGAAEEILGQLVEYTLDPKLRKVTDGFILNNRISSEQELAAIFHQQPLSAAQIRRKLLEPKNYVKHYSDRSEPEQAFDPKVETRVFLMNAISYLNILVDDAGADIDAFELRMLNEDTQERAAVDQ